MAEFVEVMRSIRRLCEYRQTHKSVCLGCPLEDKCLVAYVCDSDRTLLDENLPKIEKVAMKWAKEHHEPVYPTFAEWQKEMFPAGRSSMMPCMFRYITDSVCKGRSCRQCAEEERIPPDVAEKLGIKPRLEDGE